MDFQTTDQAELFFQNVRSIYYHRRIVPEAKVHIYTLKAAPEDINFSLSLIHNWRSDQAFLMLNHNSLDVPITFLIKSDQLYDTLYYTGESMIINTVVCQKIGESVQRNDRVYVLSNDLEQKLFFENINAQNTFLTIYKDFLRLVEK